MLPPTAREAIIAAITTDAPAVERPGPVPAAVALGAALPDLPTLTDAEQGLLREWLDRIAHSPQAIPVQRPHRPLVRNGDLGTEDIHVPVRPSAPG
jgi:hypothetical protein